jgi:DNA-binding beta-propeller fold protein YncE
MADRIQRWTQIAMPICLVTLLSPSLQAQPVLWGTASATGSFPNGRLLRIDYFTGTVQATFNGGAGSTIIGDGFTGLAVRPSNGQVFVTDGLGSNVITRFDPNTGAILGNLGAPTSSTSLDGLEFVGNVLYARAVAQSQIYRIDPDTGTLLGTLPVNIPTSVQAGLTFALGVLVTDGSTGNNSIARRDLTTGAILNEFPTPNNEMILGLAFDGASLFASSSTGIIYRLNPLTGSLLDSRNIGIPLDSLGTTITVPEPSSAFFVLSAALVGFVRRRHLNTSRLRKSQS